MKRWALPLVVLSVVCLVGCPVSEKKPPKSTVQSKPEKTPAKVETEKPETKVQVPPADPQQVAAAVERVEQLGGKVEYDENRNVIGVDLEEIQVSDDDVELFTALTHLKKLYLWGADITNAGVEKLKRLPLLEKVMLFNTSIDDDGMVHLTELPNLTELNLRRSTYLTDRCLPI